MNVTCRGCRTEIDLNASTCPICLRPRDRSEMLEDAKRLREAQAAAKARPYKILGTLALAGALGWVGWEKRGTVLSALSFVRAKAGDAMDHASDPRTYAPAAAPATQDAHAPVSPAPAASSPRPPSAAPGAAPPARPSGAQAPTPAEAARDWTLPAPRLGPQMYSILLRGWVYDLVTAQPIPYARFRLQDRLSGAVIHVHAGQDGYYEAAVTQHNSGLELRADTAGYRPEPVEENDPPWHARKAALRRKEAASPPRDILLTFAPSQEEAIVNVVLAPLAPR